jgi:DNA-directed RNA polymerase specialized sigma24 family protein
VNRNDRIKAVYSAWQSDQSSIATTNDLFEELIPFARSVTRAVLNRREDLHAEGESSAAMRIFEHLNPQIGNIVAWTRTVARNAALNVLNADKNKRIDHDTNLDTIQRKREMDLDGLNEEQRLVASLLAAGNSQRAIMADMGLSRRRLKACMKFLEEFLTPIARKIA